MLAWSMILMPNLGGIIGNTESIHDFHLSQ
jgi:hypothetical protein